MTTIPPADVLTRVARAGAIGLFCLAVYFLLDSGVKMDLTVILVSATFFLMFVIGLVVIKACVKGNSRNDS